MKIKIKKTLWFLTLLSLTAYYSCRKDINLPRNRNVNQFDNPLVKKATEWYEDNSSLPTADGSDAIKLKEYSLDWKRFNINKNSEGIDVITIPLVKHGKQTVYLTELGLLLDKQGNTYGMIKEYVTNPYKGKTKMNIYAGNGHMLHSGIYDSDRKELVVTGDFISQYQSNSKLRMSSSSNDGIPLEEVVINPDNPTNPGTSPGTPDLPGIPVTPGTGGGTGPNSGQPTIIKLDTSFNRYPYARCALGKILNNNHVFDSLINAFCGKKYNLTFQVKMLTTNARAHTTFDPLKPNDFFIVINANFGKENIPIRTVKTLLHEAFHANLMVRAYQIFGNYEVYTWARKPEEMSLNELIDVMESKVVGKDDLEAIHHEYMAKHIEVIKRGLKQFARQYDSNFDNYDDYDFEALAFEGLQKTKYFKNNIADKQINYIPETPIKMRADSLYSMKNANALRDSKVDCEK